MKRFVYFINPFIFLLYPGVTLAALLDIDLTKTSKLETLFVDILLVLYGLIELSFVVVTAVFLWGIIKYVIAAGDEEKIKEGKKYMLYGIIALVIMASVWGIIRAIMKTFGFIGEPIPGLQLTNWIFIFR